METPISFLALLWLMVMVRDVVGVSLSFCSSLNTADGSATYSQFQTNGLCSDECGSDYAFAITQGSNCWCSDYAPGTTVDTSDCDQQCPGYPYEYCGSSSGLFGYIPSNKQPEGTKGGYTPAPPTTTQQQAPTSQARSTVQETVYVTSTGQVTETSVGSVFVTVTTAERSSATTSSVPTPTITTPTRITTTASSDPETETVTRSPVTSIVTLPGQTQVSTIVITPAASPTTTIDSSPLGQGATQNVSSKGLSKGAVAGLAVGIALGVSIIAGLIIFGLWRRMKRQRETDEGSISPEMAIGGMGGTPNSVSRHTSTLSQHGLLNKNPRINTRNLNLNVWGGSQAHSATSTISPTATNSNRRSLGADQRLDPSHAIYTNEDLRHSDVSLQDNTDYSRKILSVRNRADGELEDE